MAFVFCISGNMEVLPCKCLEECTILKSDDIILVMIKVLSFKGDYYMLKVKRRSKYNSLLALMLALLLALTACSTNAQSDDKLDGDHIVEAVREKKEVSSVEGEEVPSEEIVDSPKEEDAIASVDQKSSTEKGTVDPGTSKEKDKLVSNGTEKPKSTPLVVDKEDKPVTPPVSKPKPPVEKPKAPEEKPKPTPPVEKPTTAPTPKPDPKPDPKPEPTPSPVEIPDYSNPEGWDEKASLALTKRVNEVRVQHGLQPHNTNSDKVKAYAKQRSKEASVDYSHKYDGYGEILNRQLAGVNIEGVINSWLNSPGHRNIMLGEWKADMAFSIYQTGGHTYYAGLFDWAD